MPSPSVPVRWTVEQAVTVHVAEEPCIVLGLERATLSMDWTRATLHSSPVPTKMFTSWWRPRRCRHEVLVRVPRRGVRSVLFLQPVGQAVLVRVEHAVAGMLALGVGQVVPAGVGGIFLVGVVVVVLQSLLVPASRRRQSQFPRRDRTASRRRRPWSRPLSRATPSGRSSRRCRCPHAGIVPRSCSTVLVKPSRSGSPFGPWLGSGQASFRSSSWRLPCPLRSDQASRHRIHRCRGGSGRERLPSRPTCRHRRCPGR